MEPATPNSTAGSSPTLCHMDHFRCPLHSQTDVPLQVRGVGAESAGCRKSYGPKFCHALTAPEPKSECITEPGPGEQRRRASLCPADPQFQMRAAITLEQGSPTRPPRHSHSSLVPLESRSHPRHPSRFLSLQRVPQNFSPATLHSGQASSPVHSRTNFFLPSLVPGSLSGAG